MAATARLAVLAAAITLTACGSTPAPPPSSSVTSPATSPAVISPSPSPSFTWPPAAHCGTERWAVKTGTDADAGLIDLGSVTPATVASLSSIPAPAELPRDSRIRLTETTVFRVRATLTEYKQEGDSDYHLVLSDAGHTMIAEIPDPSCTGRGSPLLAGIERARTQFDARYSPGDSFRKADVTVTVTGVGFLDFLHGQTGVAPNGIELHPVLRIRFGAPAVPQAPAASHSAVPPVPPAGACTPTTPSGNCYEPGEFCSAAEHGMTGVAGDGKTITCVAVSGGGTWHWE